jgi:hypothetical protein
MFRAMRLKFALATILALSVTALAAGTASADPKVGARNSLPVTADCGGDPISAVVNGSGVWVPAHDLNSTSVFIPLQFGAATGVFTAPDGTQFPINDPPSPPKGSANPPGRAIVNCTYSIDAAFPDGSSLKVDGSVTGFFSG